MMSHKDHKIRIATIPGVEVDQNPYLKLFYQGLRPYGIEVVAAGSLDFDWLRDNRGLIDVIHFHWGWEHSDGNFIKFLNLVPRFVAKLMLAKGYGYKIVWTVHNFFPHERHNLFLQYLENLSLAQFSDSVFVNFRQAVDDVHRWFFRKRNVHLIPHGNYSPWYPNKVSREEARRALNLPEDAFVYLLFGSLRPNRGVEFAVRAFQAITSPDSKDAYMLIVGRTRPEFEEMESALRGQIGHYVNIRRINEFVPDDRVQEYFNASDALVLPYRNIYTSGSAMLALTFATPIIAPRMGSLPELVHEESIGTLYESGDLFSLTAAMKIACERSGKGETQHIHQECARYDWDGIWPLAAQAFIGIAKK